MKRKPLLKRNAISTSSISHSRSRPPTLASLVKSKSIELKTANGTSSNAKQQKKPNGVIEHEAKKTARKSTRNGNDDKKRSKSTGEEKKKRNSLSVTDKMSLLKIKLKS